MSKCNTEYHPYKVPVKILFIEDNKEYRDWLVKILEEDPGLEDYKIDQFETAVNLEEGKKIARELLPDIVILDDKIPPKIGYSPVFSAEEACMILRKIDPGIRIIILTGQDETALRDEASLVKQGLANDYLHKTRTNFKNTLKNAINYQLGERESLKKTRLKFGPWVCYPHHRHYNLYLRLDESIKDALNDMQIKLLWFLFLQRSIPSSKKLLLKEVWKINDSEVETHTVETTISNLRKKLSIGNYKNPIIKEKYRGWYLNFNADNFQL